VERARVEEGQPRSNVLASAQYDLGSFGFNLRGQRFGSVVTRSTNPTLDQAFGAKTITDVALSYRFLRQLTLTAGADNLFDVYPDPNNKGANNPTSGGNSNFGIFPYNQFSPFGFNGRFVYGRLTYNF
jgi:iron complex outermembrane receptor protein